MDWRAVGIGVAGAAVVFGAGAAFVWGLGAVEKHPLLVLAAAFVLMAAVIASVEWRR